ncbi:hypothetical protein C8J34_104128 [Rhizobium sp. PP-F2F-G36]|nr:hypothetical protein C8J34_104128 [Rhizobium sp. PP-F2F-G36]
MPEFSRDAEWRKDPERHRPLGYSWRMPSEELSILLDIPAMDTPTEQEVAEAIVADAIVSAHLYPDRRISYSRRAEYWAKRVRYAGKGFNRDTVTKAVDRLVEKGILIDHDRRPPGKRGVQSSYLPNPMLTAFEMPKLNRRRGENLILKDDSGNLLGYKDTPDTRDKRFMLEKVNGLLSRTEFRIDREGVVEEGQWLRIDDYLVSPTSTAMHRVYNGGWTLGGRFYGSFWMNMPGNDRRHILIDDRETLEVDYDQLHARIVYAWAKKKLVGDAYVIDGFERKIAKRAFFIIVNARSYLAAKGAVAEFLTEKNLDPKLAGKLIKAMKERHHEVGEYFHTGCGLKLQNLDSQMAEYVLRVMTIQKGIPCLPIHDSFIVPEGQVKNLVRAMKTAYEKFVGKASSSICSIKHPPRAARVETKTCSPEVHTCTPCLPSTPHEDGFRSPHKEDSVYEIPVSNNSNTESELSAGTPIVRRIAAPPFLRKAQEEARREWETKLAKEEKRRRGQQAGPSEFECPRHPLRPSLCSPL